MRPALRILILAVLIAIAARHAAAEVRTWTDVTGKYKIEAEFVELAAGKVKLKTKDGKTTAIPLEKLSPADRKLANDLAAAATAAVAAAATPAGPGPLDSMVRVIGKLPAGADGKEGEFTLVGIAIAATDANNPASPSIVILASRADAPKNIEPSEIDAGLAQAIILPLRGEEQIGTVSGMLTASGGMERGVTDGGAGRGTDGGGPRATDSGAPRGTDRAAPGPADRRGLADLSSKLILLRASPETKVTPLNLGVLPASGGDVVTAAVLPRPRVRAPGAPKPPIPFTRWKVIQGGSEMAFQMQPDDGIFPSAGPVPVLDRRQELVGLLTVGAVALPDKSKVGGAIGLGAIRAGLTQGGLMTGPPMPMPMMLMAGGPMPPLPGGEMPMGRDGAPIGRDGTPMSTDGGAPPMAGDGPPPHNLAEPGFALAQFVRSAVAPRALFGPHGDGLASKLPWHTNYEAFVASIRMQQSPEGKMIVDWGQAPDFGLWYTLAQRAAADQMRGGDGGRSGGRVDAGGDGGRPPEGNPPQVSNADVAALAAKRLQAEWTATIASVPDPAAGPDAPCQLNLPPLPDPLRMVFKIEPADAANWAAVQPGEVIRFSCRFEANEPSEFPTINVLMTLKQVGPAVNATDGGPAPPANPDAAPAPTATRS